ncbi:MAG: hypothetical protein KKD59_07950 [Acidobacteria bacterium]|nr:hypothetical protein [Acidobacteriota bacterium]
MRFYRTIPKFLAVCVLSLALLGIPQGAEGADLDQSTLKALQYRSIGPTRESGRFVDFAVPKQQPHTFYAATASGHLWKSTNNGQTFEILFTDEKVFSIGDVAVDPSNPDVVWLGSGEANNSRSSYWGDGIYKSPDGGKTWTNMGLKESHHIGRIVIHPSDSNILYVAALGHLYSNNRERGLYKTTDGGKTWANILTNEIDGRFIGVVDVVMHPKNPEILFACTYDKVRKPYTFNLGGPGSRIYKTEDGGINWTEVGGGLPKGMLGRIGIDFFDGNPDILYTCIENANKNNMSDEDRYQELLADKASRGMIDGEIYRSVDGGSNWEKVSPDGKSIGGGPGYYYGQIIIDPNDDKIVHVLSAASWGTSDGGKTWKSRPLGFGGDDHALWINPNDTNHMLLGYDHGMGVTWDGGKNWYHPDFQSLAQLYAVGLDNSRPYRVAGGLQDNGSWMSPSTKPGGLPINLEDWVSVGGGDGMYNEFDWKTNRYLYNESQFGPLQRTDLLTGERKSIAYRGDRSMRWNWNAPILVSPHNSDVIYHGGNKVVKSPFRGEYWEVISDDLTTNDPAKLTTGKGGDGNIQYCTITTIDESPLIEGVLWAGTDDGNVWVTENGGRKWSQVNGNITGNPSYWVSRVTASNFFPGTAYVTFTGYRRDDFRPFVFKTTDYGKTWASIAANLPEGPVNVIREDHRNPGLLFIGTEFGVFVSITGGKSWVSMKNNMPTQPVHDMKIHKRDNDLVVATHGRGIYITDITPLQGLSEEAMAKDACLFEIEDTINWTVPLRKASSTSNFEGESEPVGMAAWYYLGKDTDRDVKVQVYQGKMLIDEIKGENKGGIHKALWTISSRKERSEAEKKMIIERNARMREMGYGRYMQDPDFVRTPVGEGEYTFVLVVGDKKFIQKASLLRDEWTVR